MLPKDDPHRDDIRQISLVRDVPFILDLCRQTTGMGFTAVARVTDERWITCASLDHLSFGLLPGDELEVSSTICHEVRGCGKTVVIPDVDASETYRNHHTPRRYGFKSYISVPIMRGEGSFWGTLCAIDPLPRSLEPDTVALFEAFARLIAIYLDMLEDAEASRRELASAHNIGRMREEFLGVVGHDLRSPLAAIRVGLRILEQEPLSEHAEHMVQQMTRSTLRMERIIRNLLDFARGRLGSGLELSAPGPVPLEPVIRGVAKEIEMISEQRIELDLDLPHPIRCDPVRLGQCLANLLGNAATHGAAGELIDVRAWEAEGQLRIAVTNQGRPIPEEMLPRIFLPFERGGGEGTDTQGLGLGLHIASEIAKAHGGELDVQSTEDATTFTLTMPAIFG